MSGVQPTSPGGGAVAPAASGGWLRRRLRERWPTIRRTLPRELAIVLWIGITLQFVGIAHVATDSVHTSFALVIKGIKPTRGELAVFAYSGGAIERYYADDWLADVRRALGQEVSLAGPNKGDGFVKYMVGLPGDVVEVQGDEVLLRTPQGRYAMGRAKETTKRGVPLTPIAPQTIPEGYVYMWSPHVDGLDSRYAVVGLVPVSAIAGKAVRLW